jgi:hypothetical protein
MAWTCGERPVTPLRTGSDPAPAYREGFPDDHRPESNAEIAVNSLSG